MEQLIKKALEEIDEEFIHCVPFLDKGAFVVCKRKHKDTPFLIRGYCIKRGFYEKFFACTDERCAKLKFNQILGG